MDKSETLRLADWLEDQYDPTFNQEQAAAVLRRLHAENERLAAEVANRNRRALDGDEAVSALANVHAYYEGLEAQRDALLEALKQSLEEAIYPSKMLSDVYEKARAAIAAVEEGK